MKVRRINEAEEVRTTGNVKYTVLDTSEHNINSVVSGHRDMIIKVVNGATKEDVKNAFEFGPTSVLSSKEPDVYTVRYYND